MKKSIIILIIIIIIIIFYFIYKHLNRVYSDTHTINNPKDVIKDIKSQYGTDIAVNVEKIYRLETDHFKSEQYKKTGSAGMLSFNSESPFGWSSLAEFWTKKNKFAPVGAWNYEDENAQKTFKYLKFNNFGGFYSLAEFLNKHENNAGRWFSTDTEQQNLYKKSLKNIQTKFV